MADIEIFVEDCMRDPMVFLVMGATIFHIIMSYMLFTLAMPIPVVNITIDFWGFVLVSVVWILVFILALYIKHQTQYVSNYNKNFT
jgi:hypothetical protein